MTLSYRILIFAVIPVFVCGFLNLRYSTKLLELSKKTNKLQCMPKTCGSDQSDTANIIPKIIANTGLSSTENKPGTNNKKASKQKAQASTTQSPPDNNKPENRKKITKQKKQVVFVKSEEAFAGIGISEAKGGSNWSEQIEDCFNSKMKNSRVTLLQDFSTYSRSLPVRSYVSELVSDNQPLYLPLYKFDYYVRTEDLDVMVEAILDEGVSRRNTVKYISAPSTNGKTASVLPAFLRSTSMKEGGGTHYFYLAFDNNNIRSFKAKPYIPSSDPLIAEQQGAAFIVECVKTLFEDPDNTSRYTITLEQSPTLRVEDYSAILAKYLTDMLGKNTSIFFHVDEHGKMCDREDLFGKGAAFSRGAMSALARVSNVRVIATYVERPVLPVVGSSGVCRVPIALPPLNIKQAMAAVPELTIDSSNFDSDQRRLFASLKFRLGFKLREMNLISILHQRGSNKKAEKFLLAFAKAKKVIHKNVTLALINCNEACKYTIITGISNLPDVDATKLLLVIDDSDDFNYRQLPDIVSLSGGRITYSIPKMLQIFDPQISVYNIGRNLFYRQLVLPYDLLSGSPLETAYFWALSCRSAFNHNLPFTADIMYNIDCKNLVPGRLFPGTDSTTYNIDFLKKGVMYYADEKVDGKPTHPLTDLFFITDDENELVLVDIYGGMSKRELKDKKNTLAAWILAEQTNIPQYKLRGIILAPNVNIESKIFGGVSTVSGEDAIKSLGGLEQIVQWLE